MAVILSIVALIGLAVCFKYLGKAFILIIATLLTPFWAAWRWVTGPAEGRRDAAIIAISGFVFIGCILLITLLSSR